MPIRAKKLVLKYRGNARRYFLKVKRHCTNLVVYGDKNAAFDVLTIGQRAELAAVVATATGKLAEKVLV